MLETNKENLFNNSGGHVPAALRWLAGPRQKWYDVGNTRCGESLLKCPAIDELVLPI